jgi:DNA-binding transcriptional LysR family regulator
MAEARLSTVYASSSRISTLFCRRNMDIGQLEAFIAVAREGSFTRAAERLNLAQPSLSARIHQLELNLGAELFRRDERPVRLTVLGEIFQPYAERALGILESGREAVHSGSRGVAGRVVVGCPFSLATYLMPEVVNRFSQAYPLAALSIETNHSRYVVAQLADGLVNLAFAAAFSNLLLQSQTLLRLHDEMVAAVAPEHPLAQKAEIPLANVWPYRLLLPGWGTAFKSYVESLRQMSQESGPVMHLPLAAAIPMARQPGAGQPETGQPGAGHSGAVIFLPRRLAEASGLVALKLPDFLFSWDVVLITRTGRLLTTLEQAFVEIVAAVWQASEPAQPRR